MISAFSAMFGRIGRNRRRIGHLSDSFIKNVTDISAQDCLNPKVIPYVIPNNAQKRQESAEMSELSTLIRNIPTLPIIRPNPPIPIRNIPSSEVQNGVKGGIYSHPGSQL